MKPTAPSSPSATSTPTVDASVGVPGEVAERLALSAADPASRPEVVLARLYRAGDLLPGPGEDPDPFPPAPAFSWNFEDDWLRRLPPAAPIWLVVVEHDPSQSACYRFGGGTPDPDSRWGYLVYIDARDAREGGIVMDWGAATVAKLEAIPTVAAPTARATVDPPTPNLEQATGPAPTSSAADLPTVDLAGLSPDEADALEYYPLRPGNRWTYRVRELDFLGNAAWTTARITTTVTTLVRSRSESMAAVLETTGTWVRKPHFGWFVERHKPYDSTTETVFIDDQTFGTRGTAQPEAFLRLGLAPGDAIPPEEVVWNQWRVDAIETVVVPAGRFDDCLVLRHQGGTTGATWRWFCPGIGFVREEHCTTTIPRHETIIDLESYLE